jgi:hypothetical protein
VQSCGPVLSTRVRTLNGLPVATLPLLHLSSVPVHVKLGVLWPWARFTSWRAYVWLATGSGDWRLLESFPAFAPWSYLHRLGLSPLTDTSDLVKWRTSQRALFERAGARTLDDFLKLDIATFDMLLRCTEAGWAKQCCGSMFGVCKASAFMLLWRGTASSVAIQACNLTRGWGHGGGGVGDGGLCFCSAGIPHVFLCGCLCLSARLAVLCV